MFSAIKKMLKGEALGPDEQTNEDPLHLAAATLLVEAACMDGTFDEDEKHCIRGLLGGRFGLEGSELDELMSSAEARAEASAEIYSFTRTIKDQFSYEERVEMIEMLWEVAYADGKLDPHEDSLLRRVAGLLYVEDKDSGQARKRVRQALENAGVVLDQ